MLTCHGCSILHVQFNPLSVTMGAHSGAVGSGTELKAGRSHVKFPVVSLEFCSDMILSATIWTWY